MDYRKMTTDQLNQLKMVAIRRGNLNAADEICDFMDFYGKRVRVVKGRKVPHGTVGTCFWVGRFDNSKYGDPWGIYSTTRIGFKTEAGETFFTSAENLLVEQ